MKKLINLIKKLFKTINEVAYDMKKIINFWKILRSYNIVKK